VLPYFRRSETWDGGANSWRGGDGPVRVITPRCEEPLYQVFLEAGHEAGYPLSDDLNGAAPEGFGAFQTNIDRGVRASSAHAYLKDALPRATLDVLTGARVGRVLIEGNNAAGVAYRRADVDKEVLAAREVILAGGAFNSPQLLMLSGLGPADQLRRHAIPIKVDLPGVGENLQDHPCVYMQYACADPLSVTRHLRLDRMVVMGLQWFLFQRGPAAGNNLETMALIRSAAAEPQPDVLIQHLAIVFDHDKGVLRDRHGFTYCIGPNRVESRGWVRLRSADPDAPPHILTNFLATARDFRVMREAVRIGREVAHQRCYDRYRERELSPGPEVRTTAEIDDYLRRATVNDFHPVGTCRMGTDRMAVVDTTLKVHGIGSLRVVDASIMPTIVGANTNATTIMIAEKAADLIRGRLPLPPARVPLPESAARPLPALA
jgi:choline dehydrogenase